MPVGVSGPQPPVRRPPEPAVRSDRIIAIGAVPVSAQPVGDSVVSAWGDGQLRVFRPGREPEAVSVHRGAILTMAATPGGSILTGGDDGRFVRVGGGAVEDLAHFPRRWVEHVAAARNGAHACSAGRSAHVWNPDGIVHELEHPSSVGGLAFDRRGDRLAVAHYGGVTVWSRGKRGWKPAVLRWAGSHTAVTWSPDDRFLMTAMQECALHGWRMRDRADLRMSGYAAKIKGWAWGGSRPWLATTGADEGILWPFDGPHGPLGRGPLELCRGSSAQVTAVFAQPGLEVILAGFADGAVRYTAIGENARPRLVSRGSGAAVVAVALLAEARWLFAADENGDALWTPLDDL